MGGVGLVTRELKVSREMTKAEMTTIDSTAEPGRKDIK